MIFIHEFLKRTSEANERVINFQKQVNKSRI